MNNKGFSLIELMVTVFVVAILAVVSVPMYIGQQKRAARTEAFTNLQNIALLEQQNYADNNTYVAGANTAAISTAFKGFKPGSGLQYDYVITNTAGVSLPATVPTPYKGTTAALTPNTTPCFIATATGRTGTRVAGDIFAIDCNNNKNF